MTSARAVWTCVSALALAAAGCSEGHPRGADDSGDDDILSPSDDEPGDDGDDAPDVDAPPVIDPPDAEPHLPGDPDAAPPMPVTLTITQSTNNTTVTDANSASCHNSYNVTAENSYYRAYVPAEHGITGAFSVSSVTVGVEVAEDDPPSGSPAATQPAAIRLYSYPTAPGTSLDLASMTGIGSANVTFTNGTLLQVVAFPVTATVPAGANLIVELAIPDGDPDDDTYGPHFFIGSNAAGETRSGYLRAPECDIPAPSQLAALGQTGMNIILDVTATYTP